MANLTSNLFRRGDQLAAKLTTIPPPLQAAFLLCFRARHAGSATPPYNLNLASNP
jgi:hypothetical protein